MEAILGISCDFHDAAAALVIDGRVVAAAQEERFSRRKNDARLPVAAIRFCLARAGITASELTAVAFYEETMLKFDRIVNAALAGADGWRYFEETVTDWHRAGKFRVRERIAAALGIDETRIVNIGHHQSHAASAFFCSPFEHAAVLTLDGAGEKETATISEGVGNRLRKLRSVSLPHSLGLFYSAWTAYLGFQVNEGEYKVMGMAGFGQPRHRAAMEALFTLDEDGGFRLDQNLFSFQVPGDLPFTLAMVERFGSARQAGAPFAPSAEDLPAGTDPARQTAIIADSRRFADIAASVQACTETVILHMVDAAVRLTGTRSVCLAGGVALNSLANGRLIRERGYELYVHPAAGDSGGAVGAALYLAHQDRGAPRTGALERADLGIEFSSTDIDVAVDGSGFVTLDTAPGEEALLDAVAGLLASGKVIGWMQGRAEWGPRALGHRSILANPTLPHMQRLVNEKIKFREPFRPFAPAVPAEDADRFFDMPAVRGAWQPEHFMLAVHPVRDAWRARLPAITHVDGTARVQAVRADVNPRLHALLRRFERTGGVPVLLNTSFNLNGEPIVNSPADALATFTHSGLDALVLGHRIVTKKVVL